MKTIAAFPYSVVEDPHVLIPMSDGRKLSARIWRPESADPAPVILEYLPYRKRDGTCARDALTHPYFAERGYACLRVDMRGNGDSHGLMEDEYTQTELDDAVAVIEWVADQPWCNGKVGMMGISWGGFNSLQVAAMAPEALKAIIDQAESRRIETIFRDIREQITRKREPGDPDASILVHRMDSNEPGVAMPELGRSTIDHRAVALMRDWIAEMN